MLIAMAIFGTMLAAAFMIFSSGLQTKRSEDLKLGLQQNLRAAMEVISQDLRSSGVLHLYNQSPCSSSVPCSNNTQVAVLALDGTNTAIATTPGSNMSGTNTFVCDASQFRQGDVAVLYNGTNIAGTSVNNNNVVTTVTSAVNYGFNTAQVLQITSPPTVRPAPRAACAAGTSQDTLPHSSQTNSDPISLDGQSYVFKAALNTYMLGTDPANPSGKALLRLSGLNAPFDTANVVAYDVSGLTISYGIRFAPTSLTASRVIFYDSLEAAVAALNPTLPTSTPPYSNIPRTTNTTYIGGVVTAVRITLSGESASKLPGTNDPAKFSLTETVDLRN
jgi:Tfp pilus assembly protein PilW